MELTKPPASVTLIFIFCFLSIQQSFAQVRVNAGFGNRPRYYNPSHYYNYNRSRSIAVFRPSLRFASPYRSNIYYDEPVMANRYYYEGGYHPYPFYYRPFSRPSFGISINVLPRGYYPFYFGQARYYYCDGLYYQPYQGYYQTIAPPLGAFVPSLPRNTTAVDINNETYYEYKGTYYQRANNGTGKYEVVGVDGVLKTDIQTNPIEDNNKVPNAEQSVTSLPKNFKTIVLDNKVYYVSPEGEYFTKKIDEKGNITFTIEAK